MRELRRRLARLERRVEAAASTPCPTCGGHGRPIITHDGKPDREGCETCGRAYVLLAFVVGSYPQIVRR